MGSSDGIRSRSASQGMNVSQAVAHWKARLYLVLGCMIAISVGASAKAHPHVFVDGGVDFVFQTDGQLGSVIVTWRYDPFETLYILSDLGIVPQAGSDFSDEDRVEVEARLGEFPPDFDGSAHLSIDQQPVPLDWPRDLTAKMVGDRLEVSFTRELLTPASVKDRPLIVRFYERTYFFAFSLTDAPEFVGDGGRCSGEIEPFSPSDETQDLTDMLAQLSREETPQDANVGATFADTLEVTCNAV